MSNTNNINEKRNRDDNYRFTRALCGQAGLRENSRDWSATDRQTEAKPACCDLDKLCSECCQNVSHNLWLLASVDIDEERMGGGTGMAVSSKKDEPGQKRAWLAKW